MEPYDSSNDFILFSLEPDLSCCPYPQSNESLICLTVVIFSQLPAVHLLGDAGSASTRHLNSVYQDLSLRNPTIKLVYVTPEKLSASEKLDSVMKSLYNRGLLDR